MKALRCRFCNEPLVEPFADLGMAPLSNSYLRADELDRMEPFYPLIAYVCGGCFLVQLPAVATPEQIFGEYAYFSSVADTWVTHARNYCRLMRDRLKLDRHSQVVEIASNDGYLLQFFKAEGIPVLGIEPATNVAVEARKKGVETRVEFFGTASATRLVTDGKQADLLLGNNVLAHVPELNDFVEGLRTALKPSGMITLEFPHLMRLMIGNQFDTIYHEHVSYFSLLTVRRVFAAHSLTVVDVDELPTHGGSLRVYAQHARDGATMASAVAALEARERRFGLDRIETYRGFADQVRQTKRALLHFLIQAKENGQRVVGYGAPAKGNTLLNYCGVRTDLLEFTVDRSPHKQGLFLPGTHIPIYPPDRIRETRPDYVLILPWNLKNEILEQMQDVRGAGVKFVVPIPRVEVVE